MLLHALTAGLLAVSVGLFLTVLRLFGRGRHEIVMKAVSVLFGALFLAGYLMDRDAIFGVSNLAPIGGLRILGTGGVFALVWLTAAGAIFLCLYPFFRKSCPAFDVLTVLPCAMFLLDIIFLNDFVAAHTGTALSLPTLRSTLLTLEAGVGLGYSVYAFIFSAKRFPSYKRQLGWMALALLGMALCSFPNYGLQLLFNPNRYGWTVDDLNLYHRLYIYPAFVIPVVLYFLLANKPQEVKRAVLLYYALAALWNYMGTQKIPMIWGLEHVGSLPLHLCNTALYITPLCLTFKWKKVFYFTYFINVLGAFLALTMPNYNTDGLNGSILMQGTLSFYRSHYQAFFMPLLVVGLGIFERPRLRQFLWSMAGFAFYYLLVLVLNGWFTNYGSVDYFFTNSDFIADKLGSWAEHTRDFVWTFSVGGLTFTYYPLYQSLFFLVYCILALGMWFLYELAYKSVAGWADLGARRKKIRMDMLALQAGGQKKGEPMKDAETLSIRGFSKRYGGSDVYAVKDVRLDVRGGEIFGFLGPNGAGKSTIIKSIVGIQPITEGNILVCGYDVEKQSVQSKLNIGFVPDHYALYEKLTAREYVNYIADLYGVSKQDRDERMARFLDIFELQKAADEPISTYSHGMKQKVAIMAALIHDPKLWILDEPLTGLDPNSIYQVKECMKEHARRGNAVFFSSHLIDVVERVCDRIAIIRKGQIQCVCDVHEIEQNGSLEAFYMNVINSKEVKPVRYGKTVKD